MRVATIYLPSFPLQVHVRRAPHLAGRAFAVASPAPHPTVIACSRAGWDLGIRVGMSTMKAHAVAPELIVVGSDADAYQHAAEALAETLLAVASVVELDTERVENPAGQSLLVRVPAGVRGATFGQKLLALVSRHGYRARAGIADDRFTSRVAAYVGAPNVALDPSGHHPFDQSCVVVPRGGAAAFLAPMPIRLLPLEEEMRHALESLDIHTIGEFASLPRPSVARRRASTNTSHDLHALAAGDGPCALHELVPGGRVAESLELERPCNEAEPLGFLLRPLIDRACDRVYGRGNAVAAIALRMYGTPAGAAVPRWRETMFRPMEPTLSGRALLDLIRDGLGHVPLPFPITDVSVVVLEESSSFPELPELPDDTADAGDAQANRARAISEFRLEPVIPRDRVDHRRTRRGKNRRRHRRPDHRVSRSTD